MRIVFDVGGTTTRIAGSIDGKTIGDPVIFETPKKFERFVRSFLEALDRVAKNISVDSVAGGIAGVISSDGVIIRSPNLRGFEGKAFVATISKRVKSNVYVENDCVMVGLGELSKQPSSGRSGIAAYVTISTGVGASRFVRGVPDHHRFSFEPGQQFIMYENKKPITWESLVSGTSIKKSTGKIPSDIKDRKFWKTEAELIAIGLINMIVHWTPDVVILGGGVITKTDISVFEIERFIKRYLHIYPEIPEIKKAQLGDFGGLYGALEYLRMKEKK